MTLNNLKLAQARNQGLAVDVVYDVLERVGGGEREGRGEGEEGIYFFPQICA